MPFLIAKASGFEKTSEFVRKVLFNFVKELIWLYNFYVKRTSWFGHSVSRDEPWAVSVHDQIGSYSLYSMRLSWYLLWSNGASNWYFGISTFWITYESQCEEKSKLISTPYDNAHENKQGSQFEHPYHRYPFFIPVIVPWFRAS